MNKGQLTLELVIKFLLVLMVLTVIGFLIFFFAGDFFEKTQNEISGAGKTCSEMAILQAGVGYMVPSGQCDTSKGTVILAKNTLDQASSGNVCCIDISTSKSDFSCSQAIAMAKTKNPQFTYSSANAKSEQECTNLKGTGSYSRSLFVNGIENCCILERQTQ